MNDTIDFGPLSDKLDGHLILPNQADYEQYRRVWNGLYDHHPAAIARCGTTEEVVAAVTFARENDVLLAVRGGGHSYAGNSSCDGGLVIELSRMNQMSIDADSRTARVQPGVKWDQFFREAEPFGLAVPAGPPQAGVAGVTLGGGVGILSRKWGLTLDNLLSAEVVTAGGEVVRASESENQDLFWALRGGSGNFGVVTSFELQLHQLGDQVLAGQIIHPWGAAADALRFYRDFIATAPDEIGLFVLLFTLPPLEFFPTEFHGKTAVCFTACYAGPPEKGLAALKPLREFGTPIVDTIQPQTYAAFKHADDAAIEAWDRVATKSHNVSDLTDEFIDTYLEKAANLPGTATLLGILPMTGRISAVAGDATAYPHRDGAHEVDIWAAWSDPAQDEELQAWARGFAESLQPFATGGVYVNCLGGDEPNRVPAAYGANFERLAGVKAKWDPTNLFRRNHNIPPAR